MAAPLTVGILMSRVRVEEKLLLTELERRGVAVVRFDDRELTLDLQEQSIHCDVVIERCVNHLRALYALRVLNDWGVATVNTYDVANTCGDKLLTTAALVRDRVPSPRTILAFTPESALEAIEQIGYPVVMKPAVGSWGRLLARINDRDAAEAILEHKVTLGSFHHGAFYIQEYVKKPGRDIRSFVVGDETICAIYRDSPHWITNTARGAVSKPCPVTPEIEAIALAACKAVGARWAGVDLVELADGYTCVEVNTGGEFHGLMKTTDRNIAAEIVNELLLAFRVRGDFGLAFT